MDIHGNVGPEDADDIRRILAEGLPADIGDEDAAARLGWKSAAQRKAALIEVQLASIDAGRRYEAGTLSREAYAEILLAQQQTFGKKSAEGL